MSVIQAPHTFDRPGEYAKKYILKPSINYGLLETFFKVVTDINTRKQVIFISEIPGYITVKDAGCNSTFGDAQPTRTEKWWNPENVEATLTQCYTDFYGSLYEESLQKGNDKPYLEGTENEALLLSVMTPAAYRDRVRMSMLSDKAITAAQLAGSAAKVKYYDQVDGIWRKLTNAVTALLTPRYTITKNAGATYAAQKLAVDEALDILEGVSDAQTLRMKQTSNDTKVYFVTRAIYDNYKKTLTKNKALESSWQLMQDGTKVLTYDGIPLVVNDVMDLALNADFNNGTKIDLPHRVILTVKDNLQVGFDVDPSQRFDAWDEKKEKRWYARMMYKIDTQIADEELVVVGY